jgi:hypothetical protein
MSAFLLTEDRMRELSNIAQKETKPPTQAQREEDTTTAQHLKVEYDGSLNIYGKGHSKSANRIDLQL